MAKAYTNKIFRYSWSGKRTGWDYRLDIIPSDTINQNSELLTIIQIPDGAIETIKYENELDDYFIGSTNPIINIKFNLNFTLVSNSNAETDFNRTLLYPFQEQIWNESLNSTDDFLDDTQIPFNFITGTLYKLYGKLNNNDSTGEYRLLYCGCQKTGISNGYNIKENTLEVEIHSLHRAILESFNIELLQYFWRFNANFESDTSLIDWIYFLTGGVYPNYWVTGSTPVSSETTWQEQNAYVWFAQHSAYNLYLQKIVQIIAEKFLRDSQTSTYFKFYLPLVYYRYKQLYNNTVGATIDRVGLLGSPLAIDSNYNTNTYYPCFIANKDHTEMENAVIVGGMCAGDLAESYKNLWDYMVDVYKEHMVTQNFRLVQGVSTYPIWSIHYDWLLGQYDSEVSININGNDNSIFNIEAEIQSDILKRSQSPLSKSIAKDINLIESVNPSSRAESTASFPVVHTNVPIVYDDDFRTIAGIDNSFSITQTLTKHYQRSSRNIHMRGLYYKERPKITNTENYITTRDKFIRIHERCDYILGNNNITTGSIVPYTYGDYTSMSFDAQPIGSAESLNTQLISGKQNILAKTMLHYFGNEYLTKLKYDCFLNCSVDYDNATWKFPWLDLSFGIINFDMNLLSPNNDINLFSEYPEKWKIKKVEIDFNEEIVTCEMIGIYL